jgi:hypothetical protein
MNTYACLGADAFEVAGVSLLLLAVLILCAGERNSRVKRQHLPSQHVVLDAMLASKATK